MINIPIYRAKKVDSVEYIEGYYFEYLTIEKHYLRTRESEPFAEEIDPTTLAIHFSEMIDIQGSKIFASLSKDGKGGDITSKGICVYEPKYSQFRIITNMEIRTWLEIVRGDLDNYPIKVIGIKE